MLGVALEGGGARGAFHVGAIKALLEEGYEIDGVVGTSIGAFNAAMIAQGDFEKCFEMWCNISPKQLFDIEDRHMANVLTRNINLKTISYFSSEAKKIISNRGIDSENLRKVVDDLYWVGGNDHRLALFENIHPIPRGVSYNSYLLLDEKTVLFDTVDWSICRQFLENVEHVLDGRDLDYLVINHMEPDHGASI